MTSNHFVHRIR